MPYNDRYDDYDDYLNSEGLNADEGMDRDDIPDEDRWFDF